MVNPSLPSTTLFAADLDGGSLVKIIYRKDNVEKKVTVYNYLVSNEVEKRKLPPVVVKIIELASKIL